MNYECKLFTVGPRSKKQSNPVKCSTMDDLTSEECERLLGKYVPDSIRSTKTLQQLFLKYVLKLLLLSSVLVLGICSAFMIMSWLVICHLL